MAKIVLLNRGGMSIKLPPGPDGKIRMFPPGGSIEPLDETEAKRLLDYRGVVDAAKAVPQTQSQIEELQRKVAELTAQNAELKSKMTAPKAKKAEPAKE